MSTDSLIRIGTDASYERVGEVLGDALGVEGVVLGDESHGRRWFQLSETASAWLDHDPVELVGPVLPEINGVRWEVVIRDITGARARIAVARQVYATLVTRTNWQLVLMLDDWGPADAHRSARTLA